MSSVRLAAPACHIPSWRTMLSALASGKRVAIEAVPGAGKTRALLEAARDVPSLFLAYNTQLAEEVRRIVKDTEGIDETVVVTFHALCCRCLAPAHDDVQLEEAVVRAERGELVPSNVPEVSRVLVDEAQDVRSLYTRLVHVLGLARDDMSMVVAGDRNQLIYDFDEEFPASLDTLLKPEIAFGHGVHGWHRMEMDTSHRMSKPICEFVNSVFGTTIASLENAPTHPSVEVRTPRSMFALTEVLRDLISPSCNVDDTLLLVHRKRSNRPLCELLNTLNRTGRRVHMHGVDTDVAPNPGDLKVTTYWSAKGLECDTAIVLIPESAPKCATFVALTRARRRLVLVFDPREPHAALTKAVGDLPTAKAPANQRVIELGAQGDVEKSFLAQPVRQPYKGFRDVSRWTPTRTELKDRMTAQEIRPPFVETPMDDEDKDAASGWLMVATALVAAEYRATGRVRIMEDIKHPMRMDWKMRDDAVRLGFVGRMVNEYVKDDALLADDLRARALSEYANASNDDITWAMIVALAGAAWNNYEHIMRQRLPDGKCDDLTLHRAVDDALDILPKDSATYDTVVVHGNVYVRVHALTPSECYHVVWKASFSDQADAAVRAAAHPHGRCMMVDLENGAVSLVEADAGLFRC